MARRSARRPPISRLLFDSGHFPLKTRIYLFFENTRLSVRGAVPHSWLRQESRGTDGVRADARRRAGAGTGRGSVPPKPMPAELPDVLARVNGQPAQGRFDRLIKNVEAGRGPIPADKRDEVLRAALDQLIAYTVLKQEAARGNWRCRIPTSTRRSRRCRSSSRARPSSQGARRPQRDGRAAQGGRAGRHGHQQDDGSRARLAAAATDADAQDFYAKNQDKFKQARRCAPATSS